MEAGPVGECVSPCVGTEKILALNGGRYVA